MAADYDFYRCRQCRRLMPQPEMQATLQVGGTCPCGSREFRPTNLPLTGLLLPRVWGFAIARIRALGWRGLWTNLQTDVARLLGRTPPA